MANLKHLYTPTIIPMRLLVIQLAKICYSNSGFVKKLRLSFCDYKHREAVLFDCYSSINVWLPHFLICKIRESFFYANPFHRSIASNALR